MKQEFASIRIRSTKDSNKLINLTIPIQELILLKKLSQYNYIPYSDFIEHVFNCGLFTTKYNITYRLTRLTNKDLVIKKWYMDEDRPKCHRRTMLSLNPIVDINSLDQNMIKETK